MILGFSGRKQAGKNTVANIFHGIVLEQQGLILDWKVNKNGKLIVKTKDSNQQEGWGEFAIDRKDPDFVEYAHYNMWPHVKLYSFADELKYLCVELFDIPQECVYGTDKQKNQVQEHLLWENMPGVMTPTEWSMRQGGVEKSTVHFLVNAAGYTQHPEQFNIQLREGPMTAREFMQFLGTDVMRKMYEPVWVKSCINKIQQEQSGLAIIADVRFPNEAKAIEDAGGLVVRLTRQLFDDNHSSELALDDYPFKYMIENQDINIEQLVDKVKDFYEQIQHPFIRSQNVSYVC
jgi:hypothetical protein